MPTSCDIFYKHFALRNHYGYFYVSFLWDIKTFYANDKTSDNVSAGSADVNDESSYAPNFLFYNRLMKSVLIG